MGLGFAAGRLQCPIMVKQKGRYVVNSSKEGKGRAKSDELFLLFIALLVGLFLFVFRSLRYYDDAVYSNSGNSVFVAMKFACLQLFSHKKTVAGIAVLVIAMVALGSFCLNRRALVGEYAFRFRYLIAIMVLLFAVAFELSGSSIGQWAYSLPEGGNLGLLLGRPRGCRTDEYALFTGMTFAQYYDPQGSWPYFGEVIRGTATDMFMIYGQPVFDPAILVRPFQMGFLVLGLSRGLSFFWASRVIALFMSAFELGRLITDDNRKLSFLFALMMAISPVVAWWYSINSFVEMLVCFNVMVVCFDKYMLEQKKAMRVGYLSACAYASVVFVFSIYPAWQIPLGYLLLALLVAYAVMHRSDFLCVIKQDKLLWLCCVLAAVAVCAGIGIHSLEAIKTEMATDYPGDRIDCGGGLGLAFFRGLISIFLPFIPASSESGLASGLPDLMTAFNDFFPLGIVLAVMNYKRNKKLDVLTVALVVVIGFLGIYIAVGLPEVLAKVTLMGKSVPERALVIFSLANLVLLFHEMSIFKPISASLTSNQNTKQKVVFGTALVLSALALSFFCRLNDPDFVGGLKFPVVTLIALCALAAVFCGRARLMFALCLTISLFSAGLVNPIQVGIEVVDNNPLIMEIREIAADNKGSKWVSSVDWMSNITLFAGAPSINSTNIYPSEELWNLLDPEGEYKSEWNRYAHLPCEIVSEKEGHSFERTSNDMIEIKLTISDLDELDVRFVVSTHDMNLTDEERSRLRVVSTVGSFTIYEIV